MPRWTATKRSVDQIEHVVEVGGELSIARVGLFSSQHQQRRMPPVKGEHLGRQARDHRVHDRAAVDVLIELQRLAAVADAIEAGADAERHFDDRTRLTSIRDLSIGIEDGIRLRGQRMLDAGQHDAQDECRGRRTMRQCVAGHRLNTRSTTIAITAASPIAAGMVNRDGVRNCASGSHHANIANGMGRPVNFNSGPSASTNNTSAPASQKRNRAS